jgi:ABC-type glutathione transport system ATPase component
LSRRYWRGGLLAKTPVAAVSEVGFEIQEATTVAMVGASGSGKSTVARCISRLERPDSGEIWIEGTDIAQLRPAQLLPFRAKVQMIFQDPSTSMNPRFTAAEAIEEPLYIQGCDRRERRQAAEKWMIEVGLSPAWLDRRVVEFSGGQKQRLAIARALVLKPKLLILDEALSALDLLVQAEIASLLAGLQKSHSMTYLLISHDLGLVSRMADAIVVMSAGRVVERGARQDVLFNPQHAETGRLLAASTGLNSAMAMGASR